ncbi:hypothetical protein YYC_04864 [Plasmodium yoelii 17X]|uniref:Uncharacterized protein n=1 Tax=Plasmodium yoelii 17X TaxID=1323249 RepID=V7PEB7_PLAYE|nr:hypothetical protein YYC_04864 [Plasmodium yoelii 17X]
MYTVNFVNDEKYVQRIGDICGEYYVPVALPGRYKYNIEDIEFILYLWMDKISKIKKEEKKKKKKYLCLFSSIFRETKFSLILSKSRYENNFCVWEILWCAWKNIFEKSFPKKENYKNNISNNNENKYYEKFKTNIIDFQVGCIYLLFLLYFCQHVEENQYPYPIYLSTKIFNMCLDISDECEKLNIYTELKYILNFMIDTNSIILSCNDNLNEIYQDRYGGPLHIEKTKLGVENAIEINDVDLSKFYDHVHNDIKDICKFCEEKKKKNTFSNTSTYNLLTKMKLIEKELNEDYL